MQTPGRCEAPVPTPHSPIAGWFADPHLVATDDGFVLYATTDGIPDWGAVGFHAFTSQDLVHWKDHGVMFALDGRVPWASGQAWAPALVVTQEESFLYFAADGDSIGVAEGASPLGPFGTARRLVAPGALPGRAIDPAVFVDEDGGAWLHWGNGEANTVRLDRGMTSFDAAAVRTATPSGFREAPWVHRRGERCCLSWSVGDTRDADYHVAYATGPGPFGPWTERGVLLEQAPGRGILGTGHHSIARVHGRDEWVIAFHFFGERGDGFHRRVRFAPLVHRANGLLDPVDPTVEARVRA
ncbi:family 43 glycosylhydrolase [Curtobacterium sp. VKM Ac-1376]|nr:family 43 glycosylhydrolase [Curtobacterium sp. VKM Ac-1376]